MLIRALSFTILFLGLAACQSNSGLGTMDRSSVIAITAPDSSYDPETDPRPRALVYNTNNVLLAEGHYNEGTRSVLFAGTLPRGVTRVRVWRRGNYNDARLISTDGAVSSVLITENTGLNGPLLGTAY